MQQIHYEENFTTKLTKQTSLFQELPNSRYGFYKNTIKTVKQFNQLLNPIPKARSTRTHEHSSVPWLTDVWVHWLQPVPPVIQERTGINSPSSSLCCTGKNREGRGKPTPAMVRGLASGLSATSCGGAALGPVRTRMQLQPGRWRSEAACPWQPAAMATGIRGGGGSGGSVLQ